MGGFIHPTLLMRNQEIKGIAQGPIASEKLCWDANCRGPFLTEILSHPQSGAHHSYLSSVTAAMELNQS